MFDEEQRDEHDECRHEINKLQGALQNCLLLAMRRLHKGSTEIPDWESIMRFCKEAGVEPRPLRSTSTVGTEHAK